MRVRECYMESCPIIAATFLEPSVQVCRMQDKPEDTYRL